MNTQAFRRGCCTGLLACLFAGAGGASAIEMTPELQKVVAGAKAEGKFKLESPPGMLGGGAGVKVAMDWIRKELGVSLEPSWNPNVSFRALMAKIYTENQAKQSASSDVFIGTAVQIEAMLDKGIYRPIQWTRLMPGRITTEIEEGDGRALRVLTRIPGILYNKQRLPQIAQIKSMNDLLKPEFKGKFATTPDLAGFAGFASAWGPARTNDFVTKMSQQISGVIPCSSGERIASGEVLALVLDCAGTEQNQPRFKNVLALHVVPDAAQRIYNYATIPVNAANPNAGILFALFLSSPEGQKWNRDRDGSELDMYPESTSRQLVASLQKQGVKFTDITLKWGAANAELPNQIGELAKRTVLQRR